MSMQRIHNYGSSLQAFGLGRMIEALGDDTQVSFVDYEPGPVLVREEGSDAAPASTSPLRRALAKVMEYNQVDAKLSDKLRFFNHKRTYGKRYFPMIGITAEPNRNLDVDLQVIGSDEVFNCVQANSNVGYSRDLFGHASPARRLISYAGSFGNTTFEKIETYGIARELAEDFARFDAVSVRDRNSAHIVERLTGRPPLVHVDPVLAFDFMRLEPAVPSQRMHDGKYLVVYGYSGRLDHAENEVLRSYARDIGATILCFGGVQECCDRFVDCNPFELLAYFRDAEAVVTDTFHGTIFSIINDKPFGTIVRPSVGHHYGNEEKIGFLLETFGLESQKVTDMNGIADVLDHRVDHAAVHAVLTRERERTREYLSNTIP
jgi:hypothetical protein